MSANETSKVEKPVFPVSQEDLQSFVGDEIRLVAPISNSEGSVVYSGVCEPDIDLAVKFSKGEQHQLANEYEIGRKLGDIQEVIDYLRVHQGNNLGFVATEYTFSDLAKPAVPLTYGEKVYMLRDASFGIFAMHYAGYMHRDVKPSNIFVHFVNGRRASLGDLGIATPINDVGSASELKYLDRAVMTPGWASPEQYRLNPIGHKSDIFSFGLTVAKTLFGRNPFNVAFGQDDDYTYDVSSVREAQAIKQVIDENDDFSEYIDVTHLQNVSPALREILVRSLNVDPSVRPDSEELSFVFEREVKRS